MKYQNPKSGHKRFNSSVDVMNKHCIKNSGYITLTLLWQQPKYFTSSCLYDILVNSVWNRNIHQTFRKYDTKLKLRFWILWPSQDTPSNSDVQLPAYQFKSQKIQQFRRYVTDEHSCGFNQAGTLALLMYSSPNSLQVSLCGDEVTACQIQDQRNILNSSEIGTVIFLCGCEPCALALKAVTKSFHMSASGDDTLTYHVSQQRVQ